MPPLLFEVKGPHIINHFCYPYIYQNSKLKENNCSQNVVRLLVLSRIVKGALFPVDLVIILEVLGHFVDGSVVGIVIFILIFRH